MRAEEDAKFQVDAETDCYPVHQFRAERGGGGRTGGAIGAFIEWWDFVSKFGWQAFSKLFFDCCYLWPAGRGVIAHAMPGAAVGGLVFGVVWILLVASGPNRDRILSEIRGAALVGAMGGLLLATLLVVCLMLALPFDPDDTRRLVLFVQASISLTFLGAVYGGLITCFSRVLERIIRLRVRPEMSELLENEEGKKLPSEPEA